MTSTLEELAVRVEGAAGPDREIDAQIAGGLGWCVGPEGNRGGRCGRTPQGTWKVVPRYTASLDAAMTLVPEGWTGIVQLTGAAELVDARNDSRRVRALACETPALALTAAALRSRAELARKG